MTNSELIKLAQSVDTRKGNYYLTGAETVYSDRETVDLLKSFANGSAEHATSSTVLKGKSLRELIAFIDDHFAGIASKGQMTMFFALIKDYLQTLPVSNTAH
jgi:hypothetical protein